MVFSVSNKKETHCWQAPDEQKQPGYGTGEQFYYTSGRVNPLIIPCETSQKETTFRS
jgi:hypothetical protein